MKPLQFAVLIERKHLQTPAYAVIPAAQLASWKLTATTTVDCSLDGHPLGRRSLKKWDDARWFVELRQDLLDAAGKAVGDRATLALSPVSAELPAELQALIEKDAKARANWEARTDAQRRMIREHVHEAKTAATRIRRAREALLPAAKPKPPRVAGLGAAAKEVRVRIVGRALPGASCGEYSGVAVALQGKTGADLEGVVSAGAREAKWETPVRVQQKDGRPSFRGPAVHGPPEERFLYLSWIGRKDGAAPAMFRRAKLRLDAVPPAVLAEALRTGMLTARIALTSADGMPVCASVKPPRIEWSAS